MFEGVEGETKLLRCLVSCRPTGLDGWAEQLKLHALLKNELGDEYDEASVIEAVREKYGELYDEQVLADVWQDSLLQVSPSLSLVTMLLPNKRN